MSLAARRQYSYELDHVDRGDAAKMAAYIDHVRTQLSDLDTRLRRTKSPDSKALRSIIETGAL